MKTTTGTVVNAKMQHEDNKRRGTWQRSVKDNMTHKTKLVETDVGTVVLMKGEDKTRGKWKIGIVELYRGNNQETWKVQIKIGKGCLERPVQFLYSLELHCNKMASDGTVPSTEEIPSHNSIQSKPDQLNINVIEFWPKKTAATFDLMKMNGRKAATFDLMKMNDMQANETDDKKETFGIYQMGGVHCYLLTGVRD